MIIETREIYRCEYCKKIYLLKRYVEQHEAECTKNPAILCLRCKSLDTKKAAEYFDGYHGETSRLVTVFWCKKREHYLHPPKVERKGNAIEFGDIGNYPMRTECADWERD